MSWLCAQTTTLIPLDELAVAGLRSSRMPFEMTNGEPAEGTRRFSRASSSGRRVRRRGDGLREAGRIQGNMLRTPFCGEGERNDPEVARKTATTCGGSFT